MSDPARILVVCTANICRSPVGEYLLRRMLSEDPANGEMTICSAGTHARPGDPMAAESARIISGWGMEPEHHRSRPLTTSHIDESDLILTMEEEHREHVLRLVPAALPRTFTWLELARLAEHMEASRADVHAHPDANAQDQVRFAVAAAHRARPMAKRPSATESVPDPIGGPRAGYETMAARLRGTAASLLPLLSGRQS